MRQRLHNLIPVGVALVVTLLGLLLGPVASLVGPKVAGGYNQWGNPVFPTTFEYWDKLGWTDHLFLAFNTPEDLLQGRCWTSASPATMIGLYLFTSPPLAD